MNKNSIHRQTSFVRINYLKANICMLCFLVCSWPRILIEVFIKNRFGERYFSLSSVITVATILCIIPFYINGGAYEPPLGDVLARHFVWFIYAGALLYFGLARYKELRRTPGVFDFSRYSLCTGILHPRIETFYQSFFGRYYGPRTCEIYLEPLPFLLLGILIALFHEPFGMLLIVCSVLYSISYRAAYWMGDNEVMNYIDDWLAGEQAKAIIVEKKSPAETKGVQFRFHKPSHDEQKQVLVNLLEKGGYADNDDAATVF